MANFTGDLNVDKNDIWTGTAADELAEGFTGNDTLSGLGGADTIYGGTGNDTIDGGDGNDTLQGDEDNDTVHGGAGDDFILDPLGMNFLFGDAGNDFIRVATNSPSGSIWDGGDGFDRLALGLSFSAGIFDYNIDLTTTTIANFEQFEVATAPFPIASYHYNFDMTAAQFNQFKSIIFPTNLDHVFHIVDNAIVNLPVKMGNAEKMVLTGAADRLDAHAMTSGSVAILCGSGDDLVFGSNTTGNFDIGLEGGHDVFAGQGANEHVQGGDGPDTISGGGGNDNLEGGNGNDRVQGDDGNDRLFGDAGSDKLYGGAGLDIIAGDAGRDQLFGGAGPDRFIFVTPQDSGKTASTRDVIGDFKHRTDHIDVSVIDANGAAPGNTAFKFQPGEGTAFTGVKGQLHFFQLNAPGTANDKTIIEGDINGDRHADFQIELKGLINLTKVDFIL